MNPHPGGDLFATCFKGCEWLPLMFFELQFQTARFDKGQQ
jgi:hypothetical protein